VNRKKKKNAARKAPSSGSSGRTAEAVTWWRRLGKGPKWVVVTVTPLIVAAAIPGILPWASDRTRDLFGEEPLSAHGEAFPDIIAGTYWATDDVLTEPAATLSWPAFRARGAVQMGTSGQRITLESNRSGRIDLEKITAVVEQRRRPLAGTAFIADPQGSSDVALLEFRLDSGVRDEIPAMVPDESRDATKATPYTADGSIRVVEQGQPEHLVITTTTTTCFCLWRVHIEYLYRGERGELVVPPPGEKPFATTAWTRHRAQYQYTVENGGTATRVDCTTRPASCRTR
jgi:hypothetical protein